MRDNLGAGSKPAAEVGRPQAVSESALPKHKTPVKAVVKRIGGGYSMKSAADCPKLSPLGVKHTKPVCAPLHMDACFCKQ